MEHAVFCWVPQEDSG